MEENLVAFAPAEQLVFLRGLGGMSEGYSNGHNGTINHSDAVTYDSCGRQQGTSFDNSYDASIWLTRISFPLFLLVGTLGNATGIILLYREDTFCRGRKMDGSRGRKIFLQALFTSDLCYLWNRLIVLLGTETWRDAAAGNTSAMYEPGFFLYTNGFWLFMDALLSFSSQGILVLFCVDRYFALTAPLQHKTNINFQRRTTLILVCVVYFCTAASSLLLPVIYYHRLSLMSMRRHEKLPQLSNSLTRWRVFDAWFEVQQHNSAV
ncbi:hypothetical protein RvY_17413-2 [Ramazzottius varieornatus]|uniref:G-protein coupled receptors family 1 profile domain-containing protein n=1 Tax=Ramazzottius varieornatus TaxID=947166 RepID=A0A1D1W2V9_RAMVA|nr:hypothetical protein RvY_17413-2 [Ramazzottius varieornatus]